MTDAEDFDVVVVGGGIAGLTAALAAREDGGRVALLDRAPEAETGGNTRYTEAFLRMKSIDEPSPGLEDALLEDFQGHPDPGLMLEGLRSADGRSALFRAQSTVDADVVATLAEQAGPTLRWLTGLGVRFDAVPTPFMTTSAFRLGPVGGGLTLVQTLGAVARDRDVDFRFETTARRLLTDDRGVVGVVASTPAGSAPLRGSVVLACGGFEGNTEMLARYLGPRALTTRPVARGGHYNKGEGIEMAVAVGAATSGNFALFHAEPIDPRSGAPEAAIFCFPHGVLVNRTGRRFTDEAPGPVDAWYERITRRMQDQPEGVAYAVLDSRSMAVPNLHVGIRTDQPPITAPTVADLATRLDVPPAELERTVAEYNRSCSDGQFDHSAPDGLATSGLEPPKSNWARPLDAPPFSAFPVMAANVFTFGGLRTNPAAEVVDRDGRAIPRLYAAGEITGLYHTNYTGSTSVLRGAVFGRIAGRCAAQASRPAAETS